MKLSRNYEETSVLEKIAQTIIDVAVEEDKLLRNIANEGIYHMPELAFAYECGKRIMQNSNEIFGNNKPKWCRELVLSDGGPTDLVFEFDDDYKVAIEFKMRDTHDSYMNDIKKLSGIEGDKITRIFCALIDVYTKDLSDDGRQSYIEGMVDYDVSLIDKRKFATEQSRYTGPVTCVAAVWSVGTVPDMPV